MKTIKEFPGATPLQEILKEAEKFAQEGKTIEIEHSEGKIRIVEVEKEPTAENVKELLAICL